MIASPLAEEQSDLIMKQRGYTPTALMDGAKGRTIYYQKKVEQLKSVIHAKVELWACQMELTFKELQLVVHLSTGKFDFHTDKFEFYENIIYVYAAKCVDVDVIELLSDWMTETLGKAGVKDKKKPLEERRAEFWDKIREYGKEMQYTKEMCVAFYEHWGQANEGGVKMHFEKQTTWDLKGRMRTWKRKDDDYNTRFTSTKKNWVDKKVDDQNDTKKAKQVVDKSTLF